MMITKKIMLSCLGIILFLLLVFFYYFLFIRPYIIGSYIPTSKDCKKAYDCACVKENCLCTYQKWFTENKVMCDKTLINE